MLRVLAKLHICKLTRESHRYHHCCRYLLWCLRTVSSLTNPVERIPFEKLETIDDHSIKFHQFRQILQECTSAGDLLSGMSVHAHLVKLNISGFIMIWNKLLSLYLKFGYIHYAHQLFDSMPQRDVVTFNTMISASVRDDYDAFELLHLFSKMKKEDVQPNHITFSGLIGACNGLIALRLREVFHAQTVHCGLSSNAFVGSSLVDGYAKQMRLEDAIRAFDEIIELDLVSWNIMIDGCVRNNSKEHGVRMFLQMLKGNVRFDGFTLTSIIKTCSKPGDLKHGMQLHGCAIKLALAQETPIHNSLITMYSKCEKGMESPIRIFGSISEPNIISWTAMISGFVQNEQSEEAHGFYKEMLRSGVRENDFSLSSILPVYGNLANLDQGKQIHARVIKSWFGLDLSVNNALIDMYSKCGSLEDAHLVFMKMEKHDVVSCTTMIMSYGQHGKGKEALEILSEMESEGLVPDGVTFLGCLYACSHGGLVEEGVRVFKTMTEVHNLKHKQEHFACVVDMLGRAGRLNEAESFIDEMGIESDVLVWEALLGACRLHGEMELGKKSAQKIMELRPEGHGPYILLANIYAERGSWEDKKVLREKLVSHGLKKQLGCSWVPLERIPC